jgi:hypothetical protein
VDKKRREAEERRVEDAKRTVMWQKENEEGIQAEKDKVYTHACI